MLFTLIIESRKGDENKDYIDEVRRGVFGDSEIVASLLKTLFHILYIEKDKGGDLRSHLTRTGLLTLRDLRMLAIYDPAYEWEERIADIFWRDAFSLACAVRRLAKVFHREEPLAGWLVAQTLERELGSKRAKLEPWFEKVCRFSPLVRERDWIDYTARSLEGLASVLAIYRSGREVRLRMDPDVPAMLRELFRPGTLMNPDLTDEEWDELEAERDEEKGEDR